MQDIKNLGLYTFSALIQADAAIFGLLAVFLIYRLQTLDTEKRNAFDIASIHGSSIIGDAEKLLLQGNLAETHAILFKHRNSPYYKHLITIAFTDLWKSAALAGSKPIVVALLSHITLSCFCLFYANECSNVLALTPNGRILLCMVSFVSMLIFISIVGFRSLSKHGHAWILPIPSIELESMTLEQFRGLIPENQDTSRLYSVKDSREERLFLFALGEQKGKRVIFIAKDPKRGYLTSHEESLQDSQIEAFVEKIKQAPNKYWALPAA